MPVDQAMFSQEIERRGHIIDSLTWPKVLDEILSHGGNFKIREIQIGQQRTDPSQCVKRGVDFVLGGSIRDDGPLPEVIADVIEAQKVMRDRVEGVTIALMMGTMLHSIAVGNLLPAHVKTICVDISPAVVTTLTDRGTFQAIGLVTDMIPQPYLPEWSSLRMPAPSWGRNSSAAIFDTTKRQGEAATFFEQWFGEHRYEVVRLPEQLIFEGEGDALFSRVKG